MKKHAPASLTKRRQYIGSCRHAVGCRPASVLQKHGREKRRSRAVWLLHESWTQGPCYSCQLAPPPGRAPCLAPFPKASPHPLLACKAPPVPPPLCTNAPPHAHCRTPGAGGFPYGHGKHMPKRRRPTGLTIVADMIDHRGEAGSEFRKKLD